jgi:hypothetical protein
LSELDDNEDNDLTETTEVRTYHIRGEEDKSLPMESDPGELSLTEPDPGEQLYQVATNVATQRVLYKSLPLEVQVVNNIDNDDEIEQ